MNAKIFLKKHSSTILTCLGAVGVIATAVTAVKETPKAIKLLEEKGYSVTKKKPMPKTSRCICGKWPSEWYGANGYIRRCSHCGFKGTFGKTRRKSIENWNKTIREVENKCLIECGTDPCPSYPCEKFKEK